MSQASSNIANMEARIKSLPAYTEKHEWRLGGTGFTAVVSKHEVTGVFDEGNHRWCVCMLTSTQAIHTSKNLAAPIFGSQQQSPCHCMAVAPIYTTIATMMVLSLASK